MSASTATASLREKLSPDDSPTAICVRMHRDKKTLFPCYCYSASDTQPRVRRGCFLGRQEKKRLPACCDKSLGRNRMKSLGSYLLFLGDLARNRPRMDFFQLKPHVSDELRRQYLKPQCVVLVTKKKADSGRMTELRYGTHFESVNIGSKGELDEQHGPGTSPNLPPQQDKGQTVTRPNQAPPSLLAVLTERVCS